MYHTVVVSPLTLYDRMRADQITNNLKGFLIKKNTECRYFCENQIHWGVKILGQSLWAISSLIIKNLRNAAGKVMGNNHPLYSTEVPVRKLFTCIHLHTCVQMMRRCLDTAKKILEQHASNWKTTCFIAVIRRIPNDFPKQSTVYERVTHAYMNFFWQCELIFSLSQLGVINWRGN